MKKSLTSILMALVALCATASQASTTDLGKLTSSKTFSGVISGEEDHGKAAWSNTFNFTIDEGYTATISLNDIGNSLSFDQATLQEKAKRGWTSSTDTNYVDGLFKPIGAGTYQLKFQFDTTGGKSKLRTFDGVINVASVSAVPEPETYAMLLAGLGLIGAAVKRRKAKQA
jgi:hypothetical protein